MRLIPLPKVEDKIGLKKSAIYQGVKDGTFPAPVKVGSATRWREDEIDAYILALSAARPATPTKPASS